MSFETNDIETIVFVGGSFFVVTPVGVVYHVLVMSFGDLCQHVFGCLRCWFVDMLRRRCHNCCAVALRTCVNEVC